MKIVGVETVQLAEYGNNLWVRIHTDEGAIGIGETFRNPISTIAYIHETCAPFLLGKDPTQRQYLSAMISKGIGNHFNGFPTRSVEIRGNSAIDIALWDLCGKSLGKPLYELLGGRITKDIRIYNTCAGGGYNNKVRHGYNTQLISRDDPRPDDFNEDDDLLMQVYEPASLAESLLVQNINAMKIWPFDVIALQTRGMEISGADIAKAIWPIEQIRKAVGDRIDILVEYHGLWKLPAAIEIARALRDYNIYWHEEPIWMQNFDDIKRYKEHASGFVTGSENLGSLQWYREVFQRGAIDVANFDVIWVGGITEAQKIAHLAEAYDRVIAPHDCTGPVTLLVNAHLLTAQPNGLIAETVRSHLGGFYREVVTDLPEIVNGRLTPTTAPGIGADLLPDVLTRSDLNRKVTGQVAD
ncbi:MAG: mandelate racemase/muconate lactonizing enzyme family protein [Hyphomicrobiales bacterium]|nr:mandelate racemase/muconate lactonizing enzyme family protein [Hyphomicrobiales bacterium]